MESRVKDNERGARPGGPTQANGNPERNGKTFKEEMITKISQR